MRLLNIVSLELSGPYVANEVPDYVILSHRWSTEEVTFADLRKAPLSDLQSSTRRMKGFAKIQGACELARLNGYEWIWIDSCCIDKSSSAELQEAVNSMWRYYEESNICYAYLADIPDSEAGWSDETFVTSEWFTRGWTLQELIAPASVEFYAKNWKPIGTKFERYECIAKTTSIDEDILVHNRALDLYNGAQRLSWAAHRKVTREEDAAYSLLGLFDVNLPLLYGEGREKAFVRLQKAIYDSTADHSLLLFRYSHYDDGQPLLADSPVRFCERNECSSCAFEGFRCLSPGWRYTNMKATALWSQSAHEQIMMTVNGSRCEMSTVLPLLEYRDISHRLQHYNNKKPRTRVSHVAVLNHTLDDYPGGAMCLLLQHQPERDGDACHRLRDFPAILPEIGDLVSKLRKTTLLVCPKKTPERVKCIDTVFVFRSESYRIEAWNNKCGAVSHLIHIGQPESVPGLPTKSSNVKITCGTKRVVCRVAGSRDPTQLISVKLVLSRVKTWSITEVYKRRLGSREQKEDLVFSSTAMADRCSVRLPDGRRLFVKLRRLPGSARAHHTDKGLQIRYELSVEVVEDLIPL